LAESPLGSRDLMPLVDASSESLTVSRSRCSWLFLLTSRWVASVHAVVRDAFSIASTSSVLVMVVHSSIPMLAASSTSSGLS
jgi:Mg/Co/Ni transporter MgtE